MKYRQRNKHNFLPLNILKIFIQYVLYATNRFQYFLLLLLSILIMRGSINSSVYIGDIRYATIFLSKPIYHMIKFPFDVLHNFTNIIKNMFFIYQDNKYLRQENIIINEKLTRFQYLQAENSNLKKMLYFKNATKNSDFNYIYSNVYIQNGQLLVDVGAEDGVAVNDFVFNAERNFIGRIKSVEKNNSHIILLSDNLSYMTARNINTGESLLIHGDGDHYTIFATKSNKPILNDGDIIFSFIGNEIDNEYFIGTLKRSDNNFIVIPPTSINNLFNIIIRTKK